MLLDIKTLAFIQGLIFITQVIVLIVQFKVDKTYRGIGWWVLGMACMSLGVILMPLVTVKSLQIFATFANPLVISGQILLYIGILRFLDKKENRFVLGAIFTVFIITYNYYIYGNNDLSIRTIIVNATLAVITLMTGYNLFFKRDRLISVSANFNAIVFSLLGCYYIMRTTITLVLPPMNTYQDQQIMVIAGFIIPTIFSTLWTFGFIIMLNERLKIEIQESEEKAHQNSITDSLTGLANRRYFDDMLATEFYRMKRSESNMSLIMLDVDYFKKFNDTYGHLAGDECLRQIGNVLILMAGRVTDIAVRYGGEEFIVILPDTEENGAIMIAERIRRAVIELAIPHSESDISEWVTVSIGVATVSASNVTSPEQVVTLVDEALYRAKKGGRNQIQQNIQIRG